MKTKLLVAILGLAVTASSWAAGIEIRPDVGPHGTLQFGFRCQYDDRDNLNFIWLVKTSQRMAPMPENLWWSAFDTSTGRYYLPWTHYSPASGTRQSPMTFMISSKDERVVHPILRYLKTTEIHFSVDGSGDARSVAYVFPIGSYRMHSGEYFYDMTDPIKHCDVNEFDLP